MNTLTDIIATPTKATKPAPKKPSSKSAAPKPAGAGKGKATKPAQKSVKPSSTAPKAAAKGAKPAKATKPAPKAAKPAATGGRASPYAGMKIKALVDETGARDGSVRHLLRKAVLKATDVDTVLTKTVTHEGNEYPITGTILSNMINLGMIKVS